MEDARSMQEDEMLALDSIYAPDDEQSTGAAAVTQPSFTVEQREPVPIVRLVLPVQLPRPTTVAVHTRTRLKPTAKAFQPAAALTQAMQALQVDQGPTTSTNGHQGKGRGGRAKKEMRQKLEPVTEPSQTVKDPSSSSGVAPSPSTTRTQKLPPLSHLPPITLRARLPCSYPIETAPEIITLHADWLSYQAASWIRKRLAGLFDGSEVLWIWGQWLNEGMWEEILTDEGHGCPLVRQDGKGQDGLALHFEETVSSEDATPVLAANLLAHSRLCTRTTFNTTVFDCGICLENRKGRSCVQVEECGHVFCSDCLTSYLSMLVEEGFHRQASRCPDPECVRMLSEQEKRGETTSSGHGHISRDQLSSLLTTEQLARLDRLGVKAAMEADPSISYCPRAGCEAAVLRSQGDEGVWERFRECPDCGMAFCAWCGRAWHGPTNCPVSFSTALVERYRALAEGSSEQLLMQRKYGKSRLEALVAEWEQEEKTRQWMKDYTTPCPSCGIRIEKSFGCNHMTCRSCSAHYCYLCGKSISPSNPYGHFNTPGLACYNRLFDGLIPGGAVDEDGQPMHDMADLIPWEEILQD